MADKRFPVLTSAAVLRVTKPECNLLPCQNQWGRYEVSSYDSLDLRRDRTDGLCRETSEEIQPRVPIKALPLEGTGIIFST